MGQYLRKVLPSRINTVSTVPHPFAVINSSLFFGTKVVNAELHKALPAIATHVDHLCVKALQVLNPILAS